MSSPRLPRRRAAALALLAASLFAASPCLTPAARAATPQQVEEALKKGQQFLRQQQKNGNWEAVPQPANNELTEVTGAQWGGPTAIATYALLASGEDAQQPHMKQAIQFLGNARLVGVYAIGMRAQVWPFLHPTPEVRAAIRRDGDLLANAMRRNGTAAGLFHYVAGATPDYDMSVSQFGVLGMWACEQAGYEASLKFWQAADVAWRKKQDRTGGWAYIQNAPNNPGQAAITTTMTAAGVATLFITQDYLHADDFAGCRGNVEDLNIEAGLKWMGDHFNDIYTVPGNGGPHPYYSLYGVERIGVAAGRKYIGKVNWFENGSDFLVKNQNADGSWGKNEEMFNKNVNRVPSTAMALLFLSRGRAPLVMNKLAYDIAPAANAPKDAKPVVGPWNQRPRDVANLTRFVGKQIERDLNWQSVTIHAPLDELDDAPILLIAGDKPLNFTPEEIDKLKAFVEQGGIIYGNADCAQKPFADSFVKLGRAMFPDYEFAELPADHVIYGEQFPRDKWRNKPAVQYLGNGARVLMLIAPQADSARYWQSQSVSTHDDAFQFADDLFLYAIDKQPPRDRRETHVERRNDAVKADRAVAVARLEYPGNWNPEPGGWRRLAAVVHNADKVDLNVQTVTLGQGKLSPKAFPVAHLTGTATFKFPDAMAAELGAYVAGGGTLIVDVCGGGGDFAASAEALLNKAFPNAQQKNPLPADNPLFKITGKPTEIAYRRFARRALGSLNAPRLRGLEINGRLAVLYSPEDLSEGLVGQNVDGIVGYDPRTATDLMADAILFSTKPPPPPATKPAPPAPPKK